jgi:hypothetical protein
LILNFLDPVNLAIKNWQINDGGQPV